MDKTYSKGDSFDKYIEHMGSIAPMVNELRNLSTEFRSNLVEYGPILVEEGIKPAYLEDKLRVIESSSKKCERYTEFVLASAESYRSKDEDGAKYEVPTWEEWKKGKDSLKYTYNVLSTLRKKYEQYKTACWENYF